LINNRLKKHSSTSQTKQSETPHKKDEERKGEESEGLIGKEKPGLQPEEIKENLELWGVPGGSRNLHS